MTDTNIPRPDRIVAGQGYWRSKNVDGFTVWTSFCPVCGEPFTTVSLSPAQRYLNRRCAKHARRGVRVKESWPPATSPKPDVFDPDDPATWPDFMR
jgi:hypothetical protein